MRFVFTCHPVSLLMSLISSYMSEAQAFFVLSVLCDRLLPGYYSTTMYGTLLDQKVFESLVEKTMPVLWEHLVKSDVQLSVVSLPWFLSLFINSMPLVFAFRILDVFFLEGPKTLFQFGLAILRLNGEELLNVTDDGSFISVLKSYFSRLHESAHPRSESPKLHAITRFQVLMVVALNEFSGITHDMVLEERRKHKNQVLDNIESFAKRTSIRNLGPDSKWLSPDDLGAIYDRFHEVLYHRQQQVKKAETEKKRNEQQSRRSSRRYSNVLEAPNDEVNRIGLGPLPTHMDYTGFRQFLALTAKWAITDSPNTSTTDLKSRYGSFARNFVSAPTEKNVQAADHEFMHRLFRKWDTENSGDLSLQNIVNGLARLHGSKDIMHTIHYFFSLYDEDGTGEIDREGIIRMSEALLFLSRRGFEGTIQEHDHTVLSHSERQHGGTVEMSVDEKFLNSVSDFIRRCFEFADPSRSENENETENKNKNKSGNGNGDEKEKEIGKDHTVENTQDQLNAFSIGEDSDSGDLLDVEEDEEEGSRTEKSPLVQIAKRHPTKSSPSTPSPSTSSPQNPAPPPSRKDSTAANAALNPDHPLHITLPTFRMVILADELLEQFFDHFLPKSFHLSSQTNANSTSTNSLSQNLTTFANIGHPRASVSSAQAGPRTGGVFPPGFTGLRGVLDNVVSDGMRVASEVKKRMDEAQRELEQNAQRGAAAHHDDDEEDYDESYDDDAHDLRRGDTSASSESTRQADLALLEGAEVSGRYKEKSDETSRSDVGDELLGDAGNDTAASSSSPGMGTGTGSSQPQQSQGRERKSSNASSIPQRILEFES